MILALAPADAAEDGQMTMWALWAANELEPHATTVLVHRVSKPPAERDAQLAQAAVDRPSRFIRVMILPRALVGKSSLQLVNEADKGKPRAQQYKIYADAPIRFEARE